MTISVPPSIVREVELQTGSIIRSFSSASGGCINNGGKIITSKGVYFLKWNDGRKFPGMFNAEARGLALLSESHSLAVPSVIISGSADTFQFLLLEYIETGSRSRNYWQNFGRGLAQLHQKTSDKFGLDHNNYIGSLLQRNDQSPSWIEFFIEQRLKVQLRIGRDAGSINGETSSKFEVLFGKLSALLPDEPPSLLHGDLWGGNMMITAGGQPCLIDPAVYYGHREVDLAMTQLFGGFDTSFVKSYAEAYPLLPGYEDRFDLYSLYPLLVHVNLFGGGYSSQVTTILKRFV